VQPGCIPHCASSSEPQVLMVPVQGTRPVSHVQPRRAAQAVCVVWFAQSCGVPVQAPLVQEQKSELVQAVCVVSDEQDGVPVHAVVQLQYE
jgi:hypothetical protein